MKSFEAATLAYEDWTHEVYQLYHTHTHTHIYVLHMSYTLL